MFDIIFYGFIAILTVVTAIKSVTDIQYWGRLSSRGRKVLVINNIVIVLLLGFMWIRIVTGKWLFNFDFLSSWYFFIGYIIFIMALSHMAQKLNKEIRQLKSE